MPEKFVRKLYHMSNGQAILSVPPVIREILQLKKGDSVKFNIDLSKGKVWLERK